MDIEYLVPGKNQTDGKAVLGLFQNEHTPIIDLLVRESIQNSLDAKDNNAKHESVHVDFITGRFQKEELSHEFSGIEERLNNHSNFPDSEQQFLAIRDYYTTGLTGALNMSDVTDNNYGNLIKLVYQIGNAQTNLGAGGSHGLGKTIYFRIGIGIVVFYSRIYNQVTNKYESRLVASLAENQTSPNALLPKYREFSKCGVAWWGKQIGDNETIPITDEEYIDKFLNIFNIEPYKEDKIGTTIIIPFISRDKLLNHNQETYTNGDNEIVPSWRFSLEDAIKIAVQKWYCVRLSNFTFPFGKYLTVNVNEEPVTNGSNERLFQLLLSLYNHATGKIWSACDFINDNNLDCIVETVTINSSLKSKAGTVACVVVDKEMLGMRNGVNDYHPNIYLNKRVNDWDNNEPIITYFRSPGMAVSFETDGQWLTRVPKTKGNKFTVAVFVLNGKGNTLKEVDEFDLEEYARQCEMADHAAWNDRSINGTSLTIMKRIRDNVAKKIADAFNDNDDDFVGKESDWADVIGKLVLPPLGYGDRASERTTKGPGKKKEGKFTSHSTFQFRILNNETQYRNGEIDFTFEFVTKSPTSKFGLSTMVESDGTKPINLSVWLNSIKGKLPFEIIASTLNFSRLNGSKSYLSIPLSENRKSDHQEGFRFTLPDIEKPDSYDVLVECDSPSEFTATISVTLKVNSKDVRPLFKPLS